MSALERLEIENHGGRPEPKGQAAAGGVRPLNIPCADPFPCHHSFLRKHVQSCQPQD